MVVMTVTVMGVGVDDSGGGNRNGEGYRVCGDSCSDGGDGSGSDGEDGSGSGISGGGDGIDVGGSDDNGVKYSFILWKNGAHDDSGNGAIKDVDGRSNDYSSDDGDANDDGCSGQ
eukprot:XP_014778297.1 PREDICTED: cell wall protein IFF6-like [Octopus bimaculoides]